MTGKSRAARRYVLDSGGVSTDGLVEGPQMYSTSAANSSGARYLVWISLRSVLFQKSHCSRIPSNQGLKKTTDPNCPNRPRIQCAVYLGIPETDREVGSNGNSFQHSIHDLSPHIPRAHHQREEVFNRIHLKRKIHSFNQKCDSSSWNRWDWSSNKGKHLPVGWSGGGNWGTSLLSFSLTTTVKLEVHCFS